MNSGLRGGLFVPLVFHFSPWEEDADGVRAATTLLATETMRLVENGSRTIPVGHWYREDGTTLPRDPESIVHEVIGRRLSTIFVTGICEDVAASGYRIDFSAFFTLLAQANVGTDVACAAATAFFASKRT